MTFLAGATIFSAAFLLFALEPLIAKRILPWFGGSSAVWSVCLVFYQVALLAGYAYARFLTRFLKQSQQVLVHIVVLAAALFLLPIGPDAARWQPSADSQPQWLILAMLAATLGLPFAALSATSPLLQDWLARSGDDRPYRFFALSNLASLSALLAYPLLIEPNLNGGQQRFLWSAGFVAFTICCAAFAWLNRSTPNAIPHTQAEPITTRQRTFWFLLAACGSMLLLSITNHIDQNVAAVPLLWVLPLAVYLISFIVAFGSALSRRWLWLRLLAVALGAMAYAAYDISATLPLQIGVPIFLAGLFVCCVFCHSELYRLRPSESGLTEFYLLISAGGAAGAIFVGLIAPQIFGAIYEFPLSMAFTAAIALALTWRTDGWGARVLWTGMTVSMAVVLGINVHAFHQDTLALERSFYGSLRVTQTPDPGPEQSRAMFHGTIRHGDQFLSPSRKLQPTTYYAPSSGVGILLREWPEGPKRVGVVGLGTGTLAAYGKGGDMFRFYEINPQVVDLAQQYFSYLKDTPAKVEIVTGDARISLAHESGAKFDILALDAFSGDAIPVHLLTREALTLYSQRINDNGVLAFHLSNRFLDLSPIVRKLAEQQGFHAMLIEDSEDHENNVNASDWMLVTKNLATLDNEDLKRHWVMTPEPSGITAWTDDFNSLLPILRRPKFTN